MSKSLKNYKMIGALFFFWMLLTNNYSVENISIGLVLILLIQILSSFLLKDQPIQILESISIRKLFVFLVYVIIDIYRASFQYVFHIINNKSRPELIEIDLKTDDIFIATLIANALTLTPGTVSLSIEEGCKLSVISMIEETEDIKYLEERIIRKYEKLLIK